MQSLIRIPNNEKVLWDGRPDKRASVIEAIVNPFLIFVIIWVAFDGFMILAMRSSMNMMSAAFFAFHLMPVYIYIFGVVTAGIKAKNTIYVITDRAIYFQHGIFTVQTEREPLNEIMHTGIHRGIIDQMCGLGDVHLACFHGTHLISNIKDYEKVCEMISEISTDTYTDTMYPNDLRPDTNHGYNTRYTKF